MINRLAHGFAKENQIQVGDGEEDIALLSITHDGEYICAMVLYTCGGEGVGEVREAEVLRVGVGEVRGKRASRGVVRFVVPEWVGGWLGTT